MTLDKNQRDLLASFADGPRIWDAADLFKVVCQLEMAGYVRFVNNGPKAEITEAGVAALTITLTCTYADGDTITTRFNGSPEDAQAYYVGKTFNIGSVDDNLQECVSITIHDR